MQTRLNEILASDDLPSLPEVAVRVLEIARQDEPDFAELASVVKLDPAISARLMKTVNSALFGLRAGCSSVESAMPALGVTLVRTLVLGFTLGDRILFSSSKLKNCARKIWRSSIIQATTLESLAQRTPGADPPTWFLAGMLQNIGKLAMLARLKNQYVDVVSTADGLQSEKARERRAFGFTHDEVAAELCRRWNLDDQITAIFEYQIKSASQTVIKESCLLRTAASIGRMTAEYFAAVVCDLERDRAPLDDALIRCMAIPPDELVDFFSEIDRRATEVASFMGIDIGQEPVLEQLFADAQSTLAEIAIQNQLESLISHRQQAQTGSFFRRKTEQQNTISSESLRDDETGVHNTGVLEDSIEMHLKESRKSRTTIGFLLLDVDQMKSFACRNGKEAGDDLICKIAAVLVTTIRTNDLVVRSGDDEFIAILPGADSSILKNICERIRFRIAGIKPVPSRSRPEISCSIGSICCDPGGRKHTKKRHILRELDSALFQAKKRGGNHVSFVNLSGGRSKPSLETSYEAL